MNELDIESRLNRMPITRLHVRALVLCGLGLALDLYELSLGVILSAVFSVAPHEATPFELSVLLSSVYVGALLGAPVMGWLADRYGRRNLMSALLCVVAIGSILGAFGQTVPQLAVTRVLTGLALGGYPAVMLAYLTDVLPPKRRGLLIMIVAALATAVPAAGILSIRSMGAVEPLGIEPWRWAFIIGGIGALIVGVTFLCLPKSPRWLLSRRLETEAEANLQRLERSQITMDARFDGAAVESDLDRQRIEVTPRRRWTTIVALYLLSPWGTVAFPVLAGTVLTHMGFGLADALLFVGLSRLGPPFGLLALAAVVDQVDRRTAMVICAIVMMVTGFGFVTARTAVVLITCGVFFDISAAVYAAVLNLYTSESFATAGRAKAVGTAWALNRLGAAVAPIPLIALMHESGPLTMFCVIALTLVLSMLLLGISPAGRQRLAVD